MPHICLVNCQHPPDDVRVVEKFGRTLRTLGFEVSWVGPRAAMAKPKEQYGIRYHFFEPGRGRLGRLVQNHRRAFDLANRIERADVYIGVEPDSAEVAVRLAQRKRARAVFDVHEVYGDDMLQRWSLPGTRAALKKIVRYGLQKVAVRSDVVIGVNDAVLEPYNGTKTPRMIVRNCAPREFASGPAAPVFREEARLTAMQGQATLAHGSIEVVRAFGIAAKQLSGLRVIFFEAGDLGGSGLARDEFDRIIRDAGAEEIVDVRPRIPMTAMPSVLRECDVGLITYNRLLGTASLPNKLFEFMAAGLPIIAPTYAREIRPIVEAEQCGLLVDCEDPEEIARALVYLYRHREEAREMGARAREAFLARHSFEAELAPVVDLVNQWVNQVPVRGAGHAQY